MEAQRAAEMKHLDVETYHPHVNTHEKQIPQLGELKVLHMFFIHCSVREID